VALTSVSAFLVKTGNNDNRRDSYETNRSIGHHLEYEHWGIWHGWIAPISLILGLFNDTYRVYEVNNTGWFYDLGFYIAIISGFGGVAVTRKSRG